MPYTPPERKSKLPLIIVVVAAMWIIGSLLPDDHKECERAYREDYLFYDEPGGLTEAAFCENWNTDVVIR
jgi:hypothetical protein